MTFLLVLAAFAVAILSGLGVGSAGLLVVFMTTVSQMPQLTAQGLNLIFFLFCSGASLTVHLLRTPILFGCVLLLLPGGLLGSYLGTLLAHAISQALLRRLFGGLLILAGLLGLFGRKKNSALR